MGHCHDPYFTKLQDALKEAEISRPTLVIDRNRLDENISLLHEEVDGRFGFRIVVKSLPSLPLIARIMERAKTNRLMVFHQPFLNQVAKAFPDADILLGKPMPVKAAARFYKEHETNSFNPADQLQWLVDTPERMTQYLDLAEQLDQPMKVNIEIDVGLRRGGVKEDEVLAHMLEIIKASPLLTFGGFMGYEPHIAKMPYDKKGFRSKAMAVYDKRVKQAEDILGTSVQDTTLNSGGSPTYRLYSEGDFPMNELSAGSCLVKPTDFDSDELQPHVAAAFIAAPVLKVDAKTQLPGMQPVADVMGTVNKKRRRALFTYGGYWMASPVSPEGLSTNPVMGRSTNQEMLNCSDEVDIEPDDFVFLRPHQSEFVFLQFGSIAVFDGEEIVDYWPVLQNP